MQAAVTSRTFWAAWLALGALKLGLAATLPLFGDEAWYWLEGQHPAWAYSDLPAATAWLVRLGVELGGHSELAVRAPFLALALALPLLLRAAARTIADDAHADRVGLLALLLPLLGVLGLLALPDVPLTFAAALALLALLRLYRAVDAGSVALLALALTIGALSHYRFALLVVAGAIGLLLDARGRQILREPRAWLAAGIGLLAWLPLLRWNLDHAHAGVAFQFGDRHPWRAHAEGVWLPISQLLVVSPLLLVLLLQVVREYGRRWRRDRSRPWGLLLATTGVPLIAYLVLAFFADRERVSFHWLLQAWLPPLLLAPVLLASWPRALRRATYGLALACLGGVVLYVASAVVPAWRVALAGRVAYPDNFVGWREIGDAVGERLAATPGSRPLADNFMLAAQLGFALRDPRIAALDHPLNHAHGRAAQLRLWGLQATLSESDARWLVVEDSATPLRQRLAFYQALCRDGGALQTADSVEVDRGHKRFLLFDRAQFRAGHCVLPAIAWIDTPVPAAEVDGTFVVSGWAFKDGEGIERVDVLLDDEVVAQADYGSDAPHVAAYWQTSNDAAHPRVGFTAQVDARELAPGTHWLALRLHGRGGSIETWPAQRVFIRR
jgi:hypothetical protein